MDTTKIAMQTDILVGLDKLGTRNRQEQAVAIVNACHAHPNER